MKESELMKSVRLRLGVYQHMGDCLWFLRINSGKIEQFGRYIQLAPKGSPDYLALIRNKSKNITVLFLECKSSKGKQSDAQIDFQIKYHNSEDIIYKIITDITQLTDIIHNIAFDRLSLLPTNIGG